MAKSGARWCAAAAAALLCAGGANAFPSPNEYKAKCGNKGLGQCIDELVNKVARDADKLRKEVQDAQKKAQEAEKRTREQFKKDLQAQKCGDREGLGACMDRRVNEAKAKADKDLAALRVELEKAKAAGGGGGGAVAQCLAAARSSGIDPIKLKTDPQAFARTMTEKLRVLVAAGAAEATKITKAQLAQLDPNKPGPAFDPADFERKFWTTIDKVVARDPLAKCVVAQSKPQIQKAQAALKPVLQQIDRQLQTTVEPLAISAAAMGIELAVEKVGGLLGDDEAKHIMRAVIARQLLDPARVGAIATHLNAFNAALKSGDKAAAQRAAAQAKKVLTQQWNPKAEWVIELAAPALQAGVRFFLNKSIDKAAPYVYDLALAPVGEIGVPVAQWAVESVCSLGDIVAEPVCALMTKEVKAGFWATALANRPAVSEAMALVTKFVADEMLAQAVKQISAQAKVQLQKSNVNAMGQKIAAKLPPQARERLKGALYQLMLKLTNEYVREMVQNLDRYNGSVATLVAYANGAQGSAKVPNAEAKRLKKAPQNGDEAVMYLE